MKWTIHCASRILADHFKKSMKPLVKTVSCLILLRDGTFSFLSGTRQRQLPQQLGNFWYLKWNLGLVRWEMNVKYELKWLWCLRFAHLFTHIYSIGYTIIDTRKFLLLCFRQNLHNLVTWLGFNLARCLSQLTRLRICITANAKPSEALNCSSCLWHPRLLSTYMTYTTWFLGELFCFSKMSRNSEHSQNPFRR